MKTYGTSFLRRRYPLLVCYFLLSQVLMLFGVKAANITNYLVYDIPNYVSGGLGTLTFSVRLIGSGSAYGSSVYSGLQSSPHGSGSSTSHPFVGDPATYEYRLWLQAGGASASEATTSWRGMASAGGVFNITIQMNGGLNQGPPVPTTNHYVKTCIRNDSSFPMTFDVSTASTGGTILGTFTVAPNSTGCFTSPAMSSKVPLYLHQIDGPPLTPDGDTTFEIPDTDDPFTSWSSVPSGTDPSFGGIGGTPGGAPATVPGTNAPNIDFTGATGDAKDSTLKEGFSALREAIVNGLAVTHQGLQDNVVAVNAVATAVATSNSKLTTIDTSLNTVKSDTASIKSSATSIATSVAASDTKLGTISSTLTSSLTKQTEIKTAIDTANTKSDTLNTSVQAVKTSTDSLGTKLDTGNTLATTANTHLNNINNNVASVNSALSTINTGVNTVNQELDSQTAILTYIRAAVEGGSSVDTANGTKLDGINTKLTGIGTGIDGVNSKLTTLNGTASEMNDALGDIVTNTANLDEKLDGLADSAFGTANQLTNVNANLRQITNQLTIRRITQDDVDGYKVQADAAAATAFDGIANIRDNMGGAPETTVGEGNSFFLNIGGYTFDCNPMNNPHFATMASKVRLILTWFILLLFYYKIWIMFERYIIASSGMQQTRATQLELFGNSVGFLTGPAFAAIICTAIATIPSTAVAAMTTYDIMGWATQNPFNHFAVGGPIGDGLGLANAFIPLDFIGVCIANFFIVSMGMSVIYGGASMVVRWMIS